MLLYWVAKAIMTPALACYFRKSSFLGAERIPAKGPVVVIANHAASFLDAIVMGVMLRRAIHFYARGDIFRHPMAKRVLRMLHMFPIYSADLAKNDLHRNADSFSEGVEVLKKGGVLLIFPEGLSRLERNIMPLKKGVSRIILQAVDSDEQSVVKVIPIGIHYSKHAFRADLQMITGEILDASTYREQYRDNAPKAINKLTEALEEIFRDVVVFVDQKDRSLMLEQQLEMLGNEKRWKFSYEVFQLQKQLCETVSMMDGSQAEGRKILQDRYFSRLGRHELVDSCFTGSGRASLVLLVLTFPVFAIGALLNIVPYMFGRYMADNKVTRADFYTSVLVSVSAFSYVLWLIFWLVVGLAFDNNGILIATAISPFLAWISLWWSDSFRAWKFQNRYDTLLSSDPGLIHELRNLRAEVRNLDGVHV